MFSPLSEQVKKSSQPVSDLFAANAKALQAVSNQQTAFVSGFLNDSIKLIQTVAQQTEAKDVLAAQSVYAESVRERLTSTSKSTFGTLNIFGQQFADTLRTTFEPASVEAAKPIATASAKTEVAKTEVAKTAVAKTAVAKTAVAKTEVAKTEVAKTEVAKTEVAKTEVAKTAVAKKAAPAKKATTASTASVKNAPVKKATVAAKKATAPAAAKSATTKTAASKPAVATKVTAIKPATVNTEAKPAPKLSADKVPATPKTVVETNSDTTSTNNASKASTN